MAEVIRSALVPYSPQQMFSLVDAVEDYPAFLPWCGSTCVPHRDSAITRAEIHINFRGIRQSFTTENRKQFPDVMTLQLLKGPFRTLEGEWRFTKLGDTGCRVDFRLHYEFSSTWLEKLIGPVFGHIASTLVDAFLKRADRIYAGR